MILLGFFLVTTVYSLTIMGTPEQLWKIQALKVPQPVLQQFKAPDELEKKVLNLFTQDVRELLNTEINRSKRNYLATTEGLKKHNFTVLKYDGGLVCQHHLVENYVFKIPLHPCRWKHNSPSWPRVPFAKTLQKIVTKYNLPITIPKKYIIPFKESREDGLILAQKISIDKNHKQKKITPEQYTALAILIKHSGLYDISRENIVFTPKNQLAIIDTEPGRRNTVPELRKTDSSVVKGLYYLAKAF